jgi:Flp pilus assembly protein TadB
MQHIKRRALKEISLELLGALAVGAGVAVMISLLGLTWSVIIGLTLLFVYLIKMQYDMRVKKLEWEQDRIERALRDDQR